MPEADRAGEHDRWNAYTPYEDPRVIRNIPGIEDHDKWKQAEYALGRLRRDQILTGDIAIEQTFDSKHASAVHKALFDGFYDWAGEARTVDISKGMSEFEKYENIEQQIDQAGQHFKDYLAEPGDREAYITATCEAVAEWNFAHPFREGNGRTMKVVLDQFAEHTPWEFDYDKVTPDQWNTASMLSMPAADTNMKPVPENLRSVFERITIDRASEPAAVTGATAQIQRLSDVDAQAAATVSYLYKNRSPAGKLGRVGGVRQSASKPYQAPPNQIRGQGYER